MQDQKGENFEIAEIAEQVIQHLYWAKIEIACLQMNIFCVQAKANSTVFCQRWCNSAKYDVLMQEQELPQQQGQY